MLHLCSWFSKSSFSQKYLKGSIMHAVKRTWRFILADFHEWAPVGHKFSCSIVTYRSARKVPDFTRYKQSALHPFRMTCSSFLKVFCFALPQSLFYLVHIQAFKYFKMLSKIFVVIMKHFIFDLENNFLVLFLRKF